MKTSSLSIIGSFLAFFLLAGTTHAYSEIRPMAKMNNYRCYEYTARGECMNYSYSIDSRFQHGNLYPHRDRYMERRYWERRNDRRSVESSRVTTQRNARKNYYNNKYYWIHNGYDAHEHDGRSNSRFPSHKGACPFGN